MPLLNRSFSSPRKPPFNPGTFRGYLDSVVMLVMPSIPLALQ